MRWWEHPLEEEDSEEGSAEESDASPTAPPPAQRPAEAKAAPERAEAADAALAASGADPDQELCDGHAGTEDAEVDRRVAWIRYHLRLGNFDEAHALGWDGDMDLALDSPTSVALDSPTSSDPASVERF